MLHHFTIELPYLDEERDALRREIVEWFELNVAKQTYYVVHKNRSLLIHIRSERDVFLSMLRFSDLMVPMSI